MNVYIGTMHLKFKCIVIINNYYLSRLTKILLHFNCIWLCPSMCIICPVNWNLITWINCWCWKSWSITSCRSNWSTNFLLTRHFLLIIINCSLSFMHLLLIELLLKKCSLLWRITYFISLIKRLFSTYLRRNTLLHF